MLFNPAHFDSIKWKQCITLFMHRNRWEFTLSFSSFNKTFSLLFASICFRRKRKKKKKKFLSKFDDLERKCWSMKCFVVVCRMLLNVKIVDCQSESISNQRKRKTFSTRRRKSKNSFLFHRPTKKKKKKKNFSLQLNFFVDRHWLGKRNKSIRMNFHLNGNNDIERLKSSSTKRFSFSSSSKSASKEFPMNSTKVSSIDWFLFFSLRWICLSRFPKIY